MRDKNNSTHFRILHPDLLAAQMLAYEPSGLICKKIKKEAEIEEYGAFSFEINSRC